MTQESPVTQQGIRDATEAVEDLEAANGEKFCMIELNTLYYLRFWSSSPVAGTPDAAALAFDEANMHVDLDMGGVHPQSKA